MSFFKAWLGKKLPNQWRSMTQGYRQASIRFTVAPALAEGLGNTGLRRVPRSDRVRHPKFLGLFEPLARLPGMNMHAPNCLWIKKIICLGGCITIDWHIGRDGRKVDVLNLGHRYVYMIKKISDQQRAHFPMNCCNDLICISRAPERHISPAVENSGALKCQNVNQRSLRSVWDVLYFSLVFNFSIVF